MTVFLTNESQLYNLTDVSFTDLDKARTARLTARGLERVVRVASLAWPVDGALVQLQHSRHPLPHSDVVIRHFPVGLPQRLVV